MKQKEVVCCFIRGLREHQRGPQSDYLSSSDYCRYTWFKHHLSKKKSRKNRGKGTGSVVELRFLQLVIDEIWPSEKWLVGRHVASRNLLCNSSGSILVGLCRCSLRLAGVFFFSFLTAKDGLCRVVNLLVREDVT